MKKLCKSNKGFSLVELIIVVAILAACTAMISMSLYSLFSSHVTKCASEADALLSQCRVESMARSVKVRLCLYLDDDGCICGALFRGDDKVSDERFAPASVSASYTVGGVTTQLTETGIDKGLYITFARDTGSIKPPEKANGDPLASGACTKLSFTGAKTVTITMVPATGYHEIGR